MFDLKKLTLPQRLGAGLGCVLVLALVVAAILYAVLETTAATRTRRELAAAPAGWTDALRGLARMPALAELSLPRDLDGDGAAVVHDTAQWWRGGNVEPAYRALVTGSAVAADSAAWAVVLADTSLDRFVAAARMREWHALDRILARASPAARRNLLALPLPRYGPARDVTRALVIRGLRRLARGDRLRARTDLGAAMGLGVHAFEREPSILGSLVGRGMIRSAARGWERYGVATGDSASAARARTVLAWVGDAPGNLEGLLLLAPDTALAIARDSTLALGAREAALRGVLGSWFLHPRGMLFGVERRYRDALRGLGTDHDRDFATLATIAANTADRISVWHISQIMREAEGPAR